MLGWIAPNNPTPINSFAPQAIRSSITIVANGAPGAAQIMPTESRKNFQCIKGALYRSKRLGVAEEDYTTSLPLEDLLDDDVLLAYRLDNKPLEPEHGGPLRLVVPKKYAYKSANWVRKLRFTKEQELGYWEKRGYSNTADPWKEERYT